jgi:hypothetical protein
MWNGRPELARELVAERFVLHLILPSAVDPSRIDHPAAVERWVREHRANFTRLIFQTHVGPFVDVSAGIVAGPWIAEARTDSRERWVCGMDSIAFRAGKITEYWTLSQPAEHADPWSRRLSL